MASEEGRGSEVVKGSSREALRAGEPEKRRGDEVDGVVRTPRHTAGRRRKS